MKLYVYDSNHHGALIVIASSGIDAIRLMKEKVLRDGGFNDVFDPDFGNFTEHELVEGTVCITKGETEDFQMKE